MQTPTKSHSKGRNAADGERDGKQAHENPPKNTSTLFNWWEVFLERFSSCFSNLWITFQIGP